MGKMKAPSLLAKTVKLPPKKSPAKKQVSPASSKGSKVKCPECGKKYSDSMALEYHKITFHVADTETKLFSASLYSEQMNFDKNFLKISDSNDIPSPLPSATKSTSENANRKSNTDNSISKSKQMKSM